VVEHQTLVEPGDGEGEKSDEKFVRRRPKAEVDTGARTPERLLKGENSGESSGFLASLGRDRQAQAEIGKPKPRSNRQPPRHHTEIEISANPSPFPTTTKGNRGESREGNEEIYGEQREEQKRKKKRRERKKSCKMKKKKKKKKKKLKSAGQKQFLIQLKSG
jgi:hypothetical protein